MTENVYEAPSSGEPPPRRTAPREGMLVRFLGQPRLERLRVHVPYPIFMGAFTFLVALLVIGFDILRRGRSVAEVLGLGVGPLIVVLSSIATIIVVGILTGFATLGWLSGFRPFARRLDALTIVDLTAIGGRLRAAAEEEGFRIRWTDARGSFVAVANLGLESHVGLNPGTRFPMRLSFLIRPGDDGRGDGVLRAQVRTVVVWDSGEKRTLESVGARVLERAGVSVPRATSSRAG